MSSATITVLITLVVIKTSLIAVGVWARGRVHDGADFFLGGRRLGPLVASISASASSSSAWTLLGVSGAAYTWGLSAVWLFPTCVGGFAFNWYVLAPRLRRLSHEQKPLTTTDVLSGTGSLARAIRVTATVIIVLSFGTYISSQFQGAGKTLHETFRLSTPVSIVIGSAVVVTYTMLGGFWAVSLTDTVQGLLMALVALVLPVTALASVGGFSTLLSAMASVEAPGYMSLTQNLPAVSAVGFLLGVFGIALPISGQPHVVNRFMAMREDEGAMKLAQRVAVGWAVVVYGGMILLGWCGRAMGGQLDDNEAVLIAAANHLLHPVLAGVVLAAVLSAVMSTVDSQLLVVTSSITHDLGREPTTTRTRWIMLAISAVSVIAALVTTKEIFSRVLFAWTAMGSAFGPLLLVTVLRGPVPQRQTLCSMIAGFALSVAAYSVPATKGGAIERVVPFVVALAIASIRTRATASDGNTTSAV